MHDLGQCLSYGIFARAAIICMPVCVNFIACRTRMDKSHFMENKSPVRQKISGICYLAPYIFGGVRDFQKFPVRVAVERQAMIIWIFTCTHTAIIKNNYIIIKNKYRQWAKTSPHL